jgi:hypothetical protein
MGQPHDVGVLRAVSDGPVRSGPGGVSGLFRSGGAGIRTPGGLAPSHAFEVWDSVSGEGRDSP